MGKAVDFSSTDRAVQTGPANDTSDFVPKPVDETAALTRAQLKAQDRTPQNRVNRKALGHALRTIDLFTVTLLSAVGVWVLSGGAPTRLPAGDLLPLVAFALAAPTLLAGFGLYHVDPRETAAMRVVRAFIATGLSGALAAGLAHLTAETNLPLIATFALTSVGALTLLHVIYAGFVEHWAKAGRLARNVILVGATPNAQKLIMANSGSGTVNVVGIFDDRKSRAPQSLAGAPYLGTTKDLFEWPLLHEVDRIILTVTPKAEERVQMLLSKLRILPHQVCLLLDIDQFDPEETSLDDIVGVRSARMSGPEERLGHAVLKRFQDLALGVPLFLASLPVMVLIALAVRLDSRGPILFRQTREGFNGRPIQVLKFRSMRFDPDTGNKATRQVERDDPRITRIGGFLRKTSLDELPQFWNVITGEMSLVGPRPHAPEMRTGGTETSNLVAEYAHRHRVKPGITGWAQINGSRGPLHTPEAARERVKLDLEYIARANVWFNLWIMLRTLPALLGDKINIR